MHVANALKVKGLASMWALVSLLAAVSAGAAGLSLTWTKCATNAGAQTDIAFDCADPSGIVQLFAVFNSPAAANMLGLEYVIDIRVDAATLPDFWLLNSSTTPTACNDGWIVQDARPASSICSAVYPWDPSGGIGPQWGFQLGSGAPNQGRIVGALFRLTALAITPAVNYYGFHLDVLSATATESGGTCSGCTTPATLLWNTARILTAEGGEVDIIGPGIVGNCPTVNGSTGCADAAQNKTWGAIKSLYR